MRRQYFAAFRPGGLQPRDRQRLQRLSERCQLVVRFDDDTLAILSDPTLPVVACRRAIVLGQAFAQGSPDPRANFTEQERALIERQGAAWLIRNTWGNYVVLSRSRDALAITRSPFGDLGCCHFCEDGLWLVAPDAGTLRDAGTRGLMLDRTVLAWVLGRGETIGSRTCLRGVGEVRGGACFTTARTGTGQIDCPWSPWTIAGTPHRDEREAIGDLVHNIDTAVRGATTGHKAALVMISGGLDSSIVTASLVGSPVRFACMTLVSDDAAGDERSYARLAAAAAGAELFEVDRCPATVDVRHSSTARLPWPTGRSFTQEADVSTARLAGQLDATAVIDGGGGDNVFCSHRSVAAVADCLLDRQALPHMLATARALGDLAEAGLPNVLWRAMRRAWFRERRVHAPIATSFLRPAAVGMALAQPDHPWLLAPNRALPGKAVHIGLIAVAQAIIESGYEATGIDRLSPLMSQPVVEACLRVPSWMWFAPGRDRAAARRAFEDRLPMEIIDRRSKGSPNLFAATLVDRNRETLEQLLYDGVLAAEGLLDVDALRPVLSDPARIWSQQFVRILRLADVEAWARNWA